MLILGLSVKTALVALITYACERCGTNAVHEVTRQVRRISVFFVPLVPLGTKYRDTCTACGRVLAISREQAERAAAQANSSGRPVGQPAPGAAPTPQDRPASEWPPQDRPA